MTMRDRRHRITLQKPVTTTGGLGDRIVEWVDVTRTWAKRTNKLKSSADAIAAGAVIAIRLVQFDIRNRPVDTTWRILAMENGAQVIYDIRSLGPSNDNRDMAILAAAGANNG